MDRMLRPPAVVTLLALLMSGCASNRPATPAPDARSPVAPTASAPAAGGVTQPKASQPLAANRKPAAAT